MIVNNAYGLLRLNSCAYYNELMGDSTEERYLAFIQNSSEGIWLCEVDQPIPIDLPANDQVALMFSRGYLAEANEAMAVMYGAASPDQLKGMKVSDLLIQDDPQNIAYLTAFVESGYRLIGIESHEKDLAGNDKVFRNSLVGVVEDRVLKRAWGTQQDVTEQHKAIEALKTSEERLALALKVSNLGIWEWNVVTGELIWSDELKRLFGLKPSSKITFEKYQSLLHPDDRERMQAIINQAMADGKEYATEHRAVWPDGSEHWLLGRGKAIKAKGKVLRMIGTTTSIEDVRRKRELEALNRKLKLQKSQLEKLNRTKDEFISLASHQLRTPATAVKQYLMMMIEGYFGEMTRGQQEALQVAFDSNERQLTIINDLLRVAQLDAGKVKLQKLPTKLCHLIDQVIDAHHPLLEGHRHAIFLEANNRDLQIDIDPPRMMMVLENLIDNANKYTPDGKEIRVVVTEQEATVTIYVTDDGVGMKKEDISRLFQKFIRLDNAMSSKTTGSGLGLYWVKKIVELHGGTVRVASKIGKGSTFTIVLPK